MGEHADALTMEQEWNWALLRALDVLGIDKKIDNVKTAGQKPLAILMPDKPEFAWAQAIATYRNLPVQFAPVIIEPEVAYRYVEHYKEDEDE